MSKIPNNFFIFRSVGEGDVWLDGDSTWLFHYKKPHNHPAILLNFFKFCPPVVFIWFWLFFSCLRQRFFEWEGEKGSDITNYLFLNIAFHFFTTIKLIYTLVYVDQSLNSYFFFCFLTSESFSNCEQSYFRNIGYFEGIYACANLTFHLQTEKDVKFVSA